MDSVLFHNKSVINSFKILDKMQSDSIFRSVTWIIYNRYLRMTKGSSSIIWTQPKIYFAEIRDLGALPFVNEWRDESLLFKSLSSTLAYELLIPDYMICIGEYFAGHPDYLRRLAFQVTIGGLEGHGSPGKVLEPYIIEKYIKFSIYPFQGRKFENEHISAAAEEITSNTTANGAKINLMRMITLLKSQSFK